MLVSSTDRPVRCAINGYGRIGRSLLRAAYEYRRWPITIVAVNDVAAPETVAHLTRFDSTHGRFGMPVDLAQTILTIGADRIQLLRQERPSHLIWAELGIDLVFECTGRLKSRAAAEVHLQAGAAKVLISNPADARVDATIVYGVNHHLLTGSETIVSNASCTSNCIIPVLAVLDDRFGIVCGTLTTIHSAMNDQPVSDAGHSDLRLCRAAGASIVPVNTRLEKGIDRVLPRLAGRFTATAMRVPTLNVTAMNLVVRLACPVTPEAVNQTLSGAARGRFRDIMAYEETPLASIDFNHDPHSCIVDGTQTRVSGGDLASLLVWCDNEWGFANRMLDTATALTAGVG